MFTTVKTKSIHTLLILWDCDGRYIGLIAIVNALI